MLKRLTISNYALISHLEIDFSKGFSVMTGETGAGKSIILGALGLILGKRADAKNIQQGKDKCYIEGVFDISSYGLESIFKEKDLEYDSEQCIFRREIWASGKSRAFINDSPVSLNDLKEIGTSLIDVHSQHQNLLLTESHFQLNVLDILAENKELKNQYQVLYKEFVSLSRQLQNLKDKMREKSAEEDYLRFQYQQLKEAKLEATEQESLENEIETLSHIEEIKSRLYEIGLYLNSENNSVLGLLKNALSEANALIRLYDASGEFSKRLESAYIDLKDLASEVSSCQEKLEHNPERLQYIKERLDLIYSLQQKHRLNSVEELIELRDKLDKELQEIDNSDENLQQLEQQVNEKKDEMLKAAQKLSSSRKKSGELLRKELIEKVSPLGMPNMQFAVEIMPKAEPDISGGDKVNFLFSANKNMSLKPVSEIASGGEISRLMLGIKAELAGAAALPTIIFDEIDTGVSGEIADKMGEIMRKMGKEMQVIAITHLPQIAAKGDFHFFVYKEELKEGTETHISLLSKEERIKEIAQMLSGSELTEAALKNAEELLKYK